ncbi:amino acid ABC transporter substrate-binding protein [Rhodovarius crocodyli]|uniref:Amino acid ABC transporter substrate-binding protein n=1 Tax=Rhodovarius crocodyli TaxID=1979269 RepID=A0A437MIN0_9PROT|nr:ABC transporter substrate-binding protein [Rhodovarius crocodyli]RVT97476.1 amino acid ABC transporter substrate-binding protein [Rhodovarius crocodyli]
MRTLLLNTIAAIVAGVAAFGTGGVAAQPQEDRLAAMRARGELRVCAWTGFYGMSWRNPRSGELEGVDADMARALAQRLGLRQVLVPTAQVGMLAQLEAGACDIAMSGAVITPERAQQVAFTKPYFSTPVLGVANRASARVRDWQSIDRPGVLVAVAEGSQAEAAMRNSLRRAELTVLRAARPREVEVLSGRVDVLVASLPYARGLAEQEGWVRLLEAPPRFGEALMAYAVPRGDAAWLAEVNNFLAAAKSDGSLARAAERQGLQGLVVY